MESKRIYKVEQYVKLIYRIIYWSCEIHTVNLMCEISDKGPHKKKKFLYSSNSGFTGGDTVGYRSQNKEERTMKRETQLSSRL